MPFVDDAQNVRLFVVPRITEMRDPLNPASEGPSDVSESPPIFPRDTQVISPFTQAPASIEYFKMTSQLTLDSPGEILQIIHVYHIAGPNPSLEAVRLALGSSFPNQYLHQEINLHSKSVREVTTYFFVRLSAPTATAQ